MGKQLSWLLVGGCVAQALPKSPARARVKREGGILQKRIPFSLYSERGVSRCAVFFVTFMLVGCLSYGETAERGVVVYTTLKKTLLAALPLVGLLAAAPVTFAHDRGEPTVSH
jgi:hypothetical protein